MAGKLLSFLLLASLMSSTLAYPAYMRSVCDLSDPAVFTRNGLPAIRVSTPGTVFYSKMTTMMVHDVDNETYEDLYSSAICQVNKHILTPEGCSFYFYQMIPTPTENGLCIRFSEWESVVTRQQVSVPAEGSLSDILGQAREMPVQHVTFIRGNPPAEYLGVTALTMMAVVESDITYSSKFTYEYTGADGIRHIVPILKEYITATGEPRSFYYSDDDMTVVNPHHVAPHWSWFWSREWDPTDPDAPALVPLANAAYQAFVAGQVPLVPDPVGQYAGIGNSVYMYCPSAKMGRTATPGGVKWVDNAYSRATYDLIRDGRVEGISTLNWVPGMHVTRDEHNANFGL